MEHRAGISHLLIQAGVDESSLSIIENLIADEENKNNAMPNSHCAKTKGRIWKMCDNNFFDDPMSRFEFFAMEPIEEEERIRKCIRRTFPFEEFLDDEEDDD